MEEAIEAILRWILVLTTRTGELSSRIDNAKEYFFMIMGEKMKVSIDELTKRYNSFVKKVKILDKK